MGDDEVMASRLDRRDLERSTAETASRVSDLELSAGVLGGRLAIASAVIDTDATSLSGIQLDAVTATLTFTLDVELAVYGVVASGVGASNWLYWLRSTTPSQFVIGASDLAGVAVDISITSHVINLIVTEL